MKITERKQALIQELDKYFTGKPCTNGHISERYTVSGRCSECLYLANAERAAYDKWNRARCEAADDLKLSQRILEERGVAAWADWTLRKLEVEAEESRRRDAATGLWKQFREADRCRHRRRMNHPDGRTMCRDCNEEMEAPLPIRRTKRKLHFLEDTGKKGKVSFLPVSE